MRICWSSILSFPWLGCRPLMALHESRRLAAAVAAAAAKEGESSLAALHHASSAVEASFQAH